MKIAISDHFTYGKLLRFTAPMAAMMLFTSIYVIVDGMFVSNFAGKTAFAALNLIFPLIQILGSFGFMMGTGGSALVAKTLGEGRPERACRQFSTIAGACLVLGVGLAVLGVVLTRPVAVAFGAEGEMLDACVVYGLVSMVGIPGFMLQCMFQSFMACAGKPNVGFYIIVAAGVLNMALDALFIAVLGWGIAGAALATILGQYLGGLLPLALFCKKGFSELHFSRPALDWGVLGKTMSNGISELVTNVAMSVVAMAYNYQLMRLLGEDGVSAYGLVAYVSFIVMAVLIGFGQGVAPAISYQYGAQNKAELRGLFRKCATIVVVTDVLSTVAAFFLAGPISQIFVGYDEGLHELSVHALSIYSLAFLLMGVNGFGSAFFTALNNGFLSAVISFAHTLVFELGSVLLLPLVLGPDGIWAAIIVAEVLSSVLTVALLAANARRYGYR